MEKPKNLWLQLNTSRINTLLHKMEEEKQKSSYPGQFDLGSVMLIMKMMINEIEKLQKENEELKQKQGT